MPYTKRVNIQLAYPFEERRLLNQGRFHLKWYPPYILQPKLDGERCRLINSGGRVLLLSSTEDIIPAVPHINHAGQALPEGEYDGELYIHGWSWAEIHSVVSREVNWHEKADRMELHLFDIVDESLPMQERLARLNRLSKIYSGPSCIRFVQSKIATNLSEVMSAYDEYIASSYEGFIIRHIDAPYSRVRTPAMMKFKPKKTDHYGIIGVEEAISESGSPLKMIGAFWCVDDMGSKFKVGAGRLTHPQRKQLFEQFKDDMFSVVGGTLEVEYQRLSDKNSVPLFSRAVRII